MENKQLKKRILCIGDIHGNYKGLLQALERSNFDYENDTLISLGDVVDGHSQSFEVVEELLKIKNLIAIKGNHDDWLNNFLINGFHGSMWEQGAKATKNSYMKRYPNIPTIMTNHFPDSHIKFFNEQLPYYIDKDNNLFIHGGFNRHYPLKEQKEFTFWWDRDLWSQALSWESMSNGMLANKPKFKMVGDFKEVFIGHTSTQFWEENKPMHAANIWNLDTGGGWFGYITIMDIETKEFWQSDDAKSLYPDFTGRK